MRMAPNDSGVKEAFQARFAPNMAENPGQAAFSV